MNIFVKILLWILVIIVLICAIFIFIGYQVDKGGVYIKKTTDLKSISAIPAYLGQAVPVVNKTNNKDFIDGNGCFISPIGPSQFIKQIKLDDLNYCVNYLEGPAGGFTGGNFEEIYYTTQKGDYYVVVKFSIEHPDCSKATKGACGYSETAAEKFFENLVSTLNLKNISFIPEVQGKAPKQAETINDTTLSKTYTNTKYNLQISFPNEFGAYSYILDDKNKPMFGLAPENFDPTTVEKYLGSANLIRIIKTSDVVDNFPQEYSRSTGVDYGAFLLIYNSNKYATDGSLNTIDKILASWKKYSPDDNSFKETIFDNQKAILTQTANSTQILLIKDGMTYELSYKKTGLSQQWDQVLSSIINSFRFTK